MSNVRLLVGTRKGGFVLTAEGTRKNWFGAGPFFAGREVYHLKASPVDLDRIYASQTSGWFGQLVQRSANGGATWNAFSNECLYDGIRGTHQILLRKTLGQWLPGIAAYCATQWRSIASMNAASLSAPPAVRFMRRLTRAPRGRLPAVPSVEVQTLP